MSKLPFKVQQISNPELNLEKWKPATTIKNGAMPKSHTSRKLKQQYHA